MSISRESEIKKIIEEHNFRRNRIKAYLSYILDYMINKKNDKPLKTTVMKVAYLLHSKFSIYFADFDSYLYGPYSKTIDSILADLISNGVVTLKSNISSDGYEYYVFESAKFPNELDRFLKNDEKKKLIKALDEIYNKFGKTPKKNKLSLNKLLDYVYNKDKFYKSSEFGEKIKFESSHKN